MPDLSSPAESPTHPELPHAEANLPKRYPTHRKQRGGEIFTYILTAILAVALIAAGIFLCCRSQPPRTTTVTAVLSIGFLMLLLLHMSKFKHVQGFGFDAETWDEKQVEAAQLVDQLSSASEALSQQVALVASRLGLWGSGLTNPELADLLQQTRKTLEAAKIPKARRDEILSPHIEIWMLSTRIST